MTANKGSVKGHRGAGYARGVPPGGTNAENSRPWSLDDLTAVARVRFQLREGTAARIRRAAGVSQESAATQVGVKRALYGQWEQHRLQPTPDAALRLARFLRGLEVPS